MKKFLQKHFISVSITVVSILILISAGLSYYNEQAMNRAYTLREQTDLVKAETQDIIQVIRKIDVSIRGFAIMKEERFLFLDIAEARRTNKQNFFTLDSLLQIQAYTDSKTFESLKAEINSYVDLYEQSVGLIKLDSIADFKQILNEDRGKKLMGVYDVFNAKILAYETQLYQEAQADYKAAMNRNSFVQILLLILGLPTLALVLRKLWQDENQRKAVILNLAQNNRKYLFNPGDENATHDAKEVLENAMQHLQKAASFINHISEGNYQVDWEELNEENKPLNENNLVGRLIRMREQMKKVKIEDDKRLWANEGLAKFSEVIRNHQHSLQDLTHHSLVFLIKYLHAQQGSLFVSHEQEGEPTYLELVACYAFDRKKYIQKRIEIGQGILGQTYLERETTLITEIPQQYTSITSGLGDATPTCLLIVPMKYNDKVQAIIEIASFQKYEAHEVVFLERAGEFIASAIAAAQTNEITQSLLEQFRSQSEQMQAQEEEMRQNMEEMQATQEEMHRKEQELQKRILEVKS